MDGSIEIAALGVAYLNRRGGNRSIWKYIYGWVIEIICLFGLCELLSV